MSCARPCAQGAFCSTRLADTNPLIGLQAPLYAHAPVSPLRACHTPEHHSQVPTPRELREEVVELAFECNSLAPGGVVFVHECRVLFTAVGVEEFTLGGRGLQTHLLSLAVD